jgi:histone chaperone ASF1
VGINKFVFEADPPNTQRIPLDELLGVTVILLTCAYDGREFVRVGYYVNNEYESDDLVNDPPAKPVIEKIRRNVLANKPRVTRFAIKWYVIFPSLIDTCTTNQPANAVFPRDSEASAPAEFPPEQPEADLVADEDEYGAEELGEEEEAEAVETNGGEELMDKDAQMDGVESAEVPEGDNGVDEDELSEDGSVDIEGESEDELLDEYEAVEGEGAEGDEMEVDKPEPAAGAALHKEEAMVH